MSNKIKINKQLLHAPCVEHWRLANIDDEYMKEKNIDRNNEASVKKIINLEMCPVVNIMSTKCKSKVRLVYKYFLSEGGIDFNRVWDMGMPAFKAPDDPRDLFLWIWQECFGGDYRIEGKKNDYEVVDDISESL